MPMQKNNGRFQCQGFMQHLANLAHSLQSLYRSARVMIIFLQVRMLSKKAKAAVTGWDKVNCYSTVGRSSPP